MGEERRDLRRDQFGGCLYTHNLQIVRLMADGPLRPLFLTAAPDSPPTTFSEIRHKNEKHVILFA